MIQICETFEIFMPFYYVRNILYVRRRKTISPMEALNRNANVLLHYTNKLRTNKKGESQK